MTTLPRPLPESNPASRFWRKYWPQIEGTYTSPLKIIDVQRDGSQPSLPIGVVVPNYCTVLDPEDAGSFIPGYSTKILYRKAYDELEATLETLPAGGEGLFVLTGHSGIGKSLFLYIILAKRLARGLPTVMQSSTDDIPLYFCGDGVYPITDLPLLIGHPVVINQKIWALIDADDSFTRPHRSLLRPKHFFALLAAPPRNEHWHGWRKNMSRMTRYFLEPPPLEEVIQAIPFYLGTRPTEKQVAEFYVKYGISIREALGYAGDSEIYEGILKEAATNIQPKGLSEVLVHSNLPSSAQSPLFKVLPKEGSRHYFYQIAIATPFIYRLLATRHEAFFLSHSLPAR